MATRAGSPSVGNGILDRTIRGKLGPQPSIAGERIAGILVHDRVHGDWGICLGPDLLENDGPIRELRGHRETTALESAEGAGVHADTYDRAMGLRSVKPANRELLRVWEERVVG
jgi:hypothetical protein